MKKSRTLAEPQVGSLVVMPLGGTKCPATIIEDRGPLGVGGQRIVRVRFMHESTEEPFETEVPSEDLEVIATPEAPAEQRTWPEAVGDRWVGTYIDPRGRVAVVTEEMGTAKQAKRAAIAWVRDGKVEAAKRPEHFYSWRPHPRYPGRYLVYRENRLGATPSLKTA